MKYADLKRQRDEANERAIEAERLSRKEEVDRLIKEHAAEVERLKREIAIRENVLEEIAERLQGWGASMDVLAVEITRGKK